MKGGREEGRERGRKEGAGSRREREGGEGVRGGREEEKEEGREREGFWGGGGDGRRMTETGISYLNLYLVPWKQLTAEL